MDRELIKKDFPASGSQAGTCYVQLSHFTFSNEDDTDIYKTAQYKSCRVKNQEDEYIQGVGIHKKRHNGSDHI